MPDIKPACTARTQEFESVLHGWHEAHRAFMKGDPESVKGIWSHQEDVSVANPFGGVFRGWEQVAAAVDRSVSSVDDGVVGDFEVIAKHVSTDLAYVVQLEHYTSRAKTGEQVPFSLRATMIFRREDGVWKLLHRHADREVI
jgi:ketosteroid isomerase-like protein